jgi:hypothetical protein
MGANRSRNNKYSLLVDFVISERTHNGGFEKEPENHIGKSTKLQ